MPLVAGVDSSTQSCKVVVRDADTGRLVRTGRAAHPGGTEIHPDHWWRAFQAAVADAGGLDDVAALSVAGQQHGMVCLDEHGAVVRDALLWNDTRSAAAAADLTAELGADTWAHRVGVVPVASLTITKLRWLAEHEPANAHRTAAVCLPHDWLTWRLRGTGNLADLVTDRSEASGTGYFDSFTNAYCADLFQRAMGRHDVILPRVLGPADSVESRGGLRLGAGAGDNAAALLGLDAQSSPLVSLGTSGVATATSNTRPADPTGTVAGFADATGRYLPLICTLNAARVLDAVAGMLGVDLDRLSDLALAAPAGADGVVLVPYFEGERTPNLPDATGALHGLTLTNATASNVARAAIEGMLCGVAAGLDALAAQGVTVSEVRLVGGAAASPAVRRIAPSVLGVPVLVADASENVADGAARQAAWALRQRALPAWPDLTSGAVRYEGPVWPHLRERYRTAAALHLHR